MIWGAFFVAGCAWTPLCAISEFGNINMDLVGIGFCFGVSAVVLEMDAVAIQW